MRLTATTLIAGRALRRNTMRSILTALGIIIGVGAVIAMVSIGNGAKAQVEAQVASLGQNIISVFPGSTTTGGVRGGFGTSSTLTAEDADAISNEVAGVVAVSRSVRDRAQVLANGQNWRPSVQGEDPEILDIRVWPLVSGDMFTHQDVKSAAKVCVVGQTVVDQLFGGDDPIGQTLRVGAVPVKIVGVLAKKGFNYFGSDQDDTIILPYTTVMRRIGRPRTNISNITIQAAAPELIAPIKLEIEALLTQRRNGREPDFMVRDQLELAETATATSKTMTVLLGAIAGVSLLVGGIGIMNIMLVSVTERTREIGIRLAVGAHGNDVLLQFLFEAVLLSVLGGGLGVTLGIGASQIVANTLNWPVLISVPAIVIALTVSAAIGIFFGFYPARKAAMLDPIDALRYE
jgi:putative ABC transport system permease protein